jgi:hypothetical protein
VHSLIRRLLIAVSVPLALFFGVMMVVLDSGFRALSERSLNELLDAQMVSLIAATDPSPGGGYAPTPQALEPRLATPRSGLYAEIRSPVQRWRSPSTAGVASDFGPLMRSGQRALRYASFGHDRVAIESRAIQFEDSTSGAGALTFSVAVSLSPYEEQLWRFRRELLRLVRWPDAGPAGDPCCAAQLGAGAAAPPEREIHQWRRGAADP